MKVVFSIVIIVLFSVGFPILAFGQNSDDLCVVRSSWRSSKQQERGSIFVLGEFRPTATNEVITRSFIYAGTKLVVNASVQFGRNYRSDQKADPNSIEIALAVSDKSQDAFVPNNNAVAGTKYGRKWGGIYVQKQVEDGDMTYSFELHCYEDRRKR